MFNITSYCFYQLLLILYEILVKKRILNAILIIQMNPAKEISFKNRTCDFFDEIIKVKNFDPT